MYIIMPRILGESLKSLMQREGARPLREAVRILVEAADALGAAHEAGVVHRDVKPENIMLEGKGRRVQLMDFGISKALDSKDGTGLTSTGILVGTPHYMSPEQASGEPSLDHRSDQYSLAVIGYQMIAGTLPFEGESTRAILFQQMIGVPKSLASVMPDLPPTLSDVIDRALSKDPADRFPSMEAFAAALVGPDAWPHGLITREASRSSCNVNLSTNSKLKSRYPSSKMPASTVICWCSVTWIRPSAATTISTSTASTRYSSRA
jgi:serine/threonine-protein kinase